MIDAQGAGPAWRGETRSRGFLWSAVALAVIGILLLVRIGDTRAGLISLVVAIVLAAFTSVRVVIDDASVLVRAGALQWPRARFGLDAIESAAAIDVRPLAWGGWGYRGSIRLLGRAAWVLRAGPGLELRLVGRRRFVVTVDDADEAAVVNVLISRRRSEHR